MESRNLAFELAMQRAQSWFEIHAEQRMRLMYFFVLILAGNMALVGGMIQSTSPSFVFLIGIELIVVSAVFKLLDRRTAQMIKMAEKALGRIETEIVSLTEIAELALVEGHEQTQSLSYRQLFNILFVFGALVGIGLTVFGILRLSLHVS